MDESGCRPTAQLFLIDLSKDDGIDQRPLVCGPNGVRQDLDVNEQADCQVLVLVPQHAVGRRESRFLATLRRPGLGGEHERSHRPELVRGVVGLKDPHDIYRDPRFHERVHGHDDRVSDAKFRIIGHLLRYHRFNRYPVGSLRNLRAWDPTIYEDRPVLEVGQGVKEPVQDHGKGLLVAYGRQRHFVRPYDGRGASEVHLLSRVQVLDVLRRYRMDELVQFVHGLGGEGNALGEDAQVELGRGNLVE